MLLEIALQEYLYDCQLRKLSERTMKGVKNNNRRMFQYLSEKYGIFEVEEVRRVHIQSYVEYLSNLGRKETYINSIIKCMRGLFQYCVDEEYILDSPLKKIKFQKEEIPIIRTFNAEEIRRIVMFYSKRDFLSLRNKLIMVLLLDSGIRNSELCGIKMENICENAIQIHGKGKKIRYVPLTPSINKALIRYLHARDSYILDKYNYHVEYLLLSQKGKKLTPETIERVVKECCIKCNVREELRCSPHTCRHYYAQTQLKNGCDIFTVSRLLGHSNINITKRYLNSIATDDILEIAQKTTPLRNL